MIKTKVIFSASTLILVWILLISVTDNPSEAHKDVEFMNGVSFVAPSKQLISNPFDKVVAVNADWVAIMPYAFCRPEKPEIRFDVERQWWGEKSKGTAETVKLARDQGLKILLKPHVWVVGQGWTGDFKLSSEEDWLIWERSYERYILNHARYADSLNVEAFCIGLEFKHVVEERPEFWNKLIKKTRGVYAGKITYAANWDNFENIPFWDKVDFIGINAYFPLSQKDTPELEELIKAWQEKKETVSAFQRKYNKPIVFTEFGYRSIDKAAGNQWELVSHRRFEGLPNYDAQQNAYQALFLTFWNEPWFKGGFMWKWYSNHDRENSMFKSDYTPQGKPVENIIKEWYKKR